MNISNMNCLRMTKFAFFLLGFLLVVWGVSGQGLNAFSQKKSNKVVSGGEIVFRNNCISQCANCDSARGPDQSTIFEYSENLPAKYRYTWSYGENNAQTKGRTGKYQYCLSGKKTVSLVVEDTTIVPNVRFLQISKEITIGQLANYTIKQPKPDTTICLGENVQLTPFKNIAKQANVGSVRWFPDGQNTDEISVKKSGCYSVKIFTHDGSGCYVEAKIQVTVCGDRDVTRNLNKGKDAWNFGNGAKIEFNGTPSNATPAVGTLNVPEGVAKISDENNTLLFYTDGEKVFSTNGEDILYGNKLNGDKSNTQGVTIAPKPPCKGCQSEYYVFTLSKNAAGENLLYYSLVDMSIVNYKSPVLSSKDTIRGAVTIRNQLLGPVPSTQRIYATFGGADFYWLVAQDANTNILRKYKITSAGISAPIISGEGTAVSSTASGNTRISSSGTKMAITIPGTSGQNNKLDLFDYEASTGKTTLTKTIDLGPAPPTVYGVEYSPDEKKLYLSFQGSAGNKSFIYQYDLTANSEALFLASKKEIYSTFGQIGALQLDPVYHSVIFVAIKDSTYLSRIDNPNSDISSDSTKISVKYVSKAVDFSSIPTTSPITSQLGLPPSIPSVPTPSSLPSIKISCEGTKFKFTLDKNLCDPIKNEHIAWKAYRSPLSNISNTDGIMVPINTLIYAQETDAQEFIVDFEENDVYTITASVSNKCVSNYLLDGQEFKIQVLKPFKLNNVEKLLPTISTTNCTLTHDLKPSKLPPQATITFEWNTGATTNHILVNNPGGDFSLKITDTTGCSSTQSAKVIFITENELLQKPDWYICMDEPAPYLKMSVLPLANAIHYKWTVGSFVINGNSIPAGVIPNPIKDTLNYLEINQNGGYLLKANDEFGCELNERYVVDDKCSPRVIAPTVFHPKLGEPTTPTFYPLWNWPLDELGKAIPLSSPSRNYTKTRTIVRSFKVFNRWGQLVFQKDFDPTLFNIPGFDIKKPENGWDGTFQGKLVPQDTYAWVIEYESLDFPAMGLLSEKGAVLVVY